MTRGRGCTKLSGPARRGVMNGPQFFTTVIGDWRAEGRQSAPSCDALGACCVFTRKEPGTNADCTYLSRWIIVTLLQL